MIYLLAFILGFLAVGLFNKYTYVFKCASTSCLHNKDNKCVLSRICIYDNFTKGICLYHTESMINRVSAVFEEVLKTCSKDGIAPLLSDNEKRILEDIKAIKDINSFNEFMKKHGI